MNLATSVLALVLAGADGPPVAPPPVPDGHARFRVRLLDMNGIDWRGPVHARLAPAAKQGPCSVWTSDRDVVETLCKAAGTVVETAAATVSFGGPANLRDGTCRKFVADLRRVADGPPGQNTKVALVPEIGEVNDGFAAEVTGRAVDQGMMVKAALSDVRIAAIHTYAVTDGATDPKTKKVTSIVGQAQIPEVVSRKVEGEWLVPNHGVLVVAFGAYTTSDSNGRAAVRERVAIIVPASAKSDPLADAAGFEAKREPKPTTSWTTSPASTRPRTWGPHTARAAVASWTEAAAPARTPAPPVPIGRSLRFAPPEEVDAEAPECEVNVDVPTRAGRSKPSARRVSVLKATLPLPVTPLSLLSFALSVEGLGESRPLPVPIPPSRVLPTAVDGDGEVVELPPLPDDSLQPTSSGDDDEPRPAPQMKPHGRPSEAPAPRPLARSTAPAEVVASSRLMAGSSVVSGRMIGRPGDHIVFRGMSVSASGTASQPVARPEIPAAPSGSRTAVDVGSPRLFPFVLRSAREDAPILLPAMPPRPLAADVAARIARYDNLIRVAGQDVAEAECGMAPDDDPEVARCEAEEVEADEEREGPTLNLQLISARGNCQYDGEVDLRLIAREATTIRVPMADGSVVEVQARLVKKAGGK